MIAGLGKIMGHKPYFYIVNKGKLHAKSSHSTDKKLAHCK